MLFYKILLIFFIGSIAGYILELFYRRLVSRKVWMNPGFLFGPWLPLYGSALLIGYVISNNVRIESIDFFSNALLQALIISVVVTVIEFITGLIFIKGLGLKLWDYSEEKGNILGVICPLYSLLWVIVGLLYSSVFHKLVKAMVTSLLDINITYFILPMLFGMIMVDLCKSFNVLAKMQAFTKATSKVVPYEELRKIVKFIPNKVKNKIDDISHMLDDRKAKYEGSEKVERLRNIFAILGFIISFLPAIIIPFLLCIEGTKSKKYRKLAYAGVAITLVEVVIMSAYMLVRG